MRFHRIFNTGFLFILCHFGILSAQTSPRISVQGTLKDADGAAVPNGVQTVTFKLFTTNSGGTAVWEEEAQVSVKGGIYSHQLGSVNALYASIFSQPLYVGVIIDGTELLPRSELSYAPYTLYVEYAGNGNPAGVIQPYAGAVIPAGYLLCNGQALSSEDYPALFAALGTLYGDGSTGINGGAGKDFNVPDLRGEFIRGLDDGRGIDNNRALGSSQAQATKAPANAFTGSADAAGEHTHTVAMKSTEFMTHFHTQTTHVAMTDAFTQGVSYGTHTTSSSGSHTHNITIAGGGDAETRPRNIAMKYIIKY